MKANILIPIIALLILLAGCKSQTVYIPVERVKLEYRDRYLQDSIYWRDTVTVISRNDTVFKEVIKWRERFRTDTVRHVRIDSIPVVVEVEKHVNYLTRWQRIRLNALNIIGALLAIYIAFRIGRRGLF